MTTCTPAERAVLDAYWALKLHQDVLLSPPVSPEEMAAYDRAVDDCRQAVAVMWAEGEAA